MLANAKIVIDVRMSGMIRDEKFFPEIINLLHKTNW